jgi:hypothetical protein
MARTPLTFHTLDVNAEKELKKQSKDERSDDASLLYSYFS